MERTEEGRDLIETLWNVKSLSPYLMFPIIQDLIETLWNVKINITLFIFFPLFDLIETLWNVKMAARQHRREIRSAI